MKTYWIIPLLFVQSVCFAQKNKLTTVIQKGHSEVVKAAAYSPDGKLAATASRDKTVKLWDVASGLEIRSLLGHEHTVNGVEFSPDGKTVATSSADNTARLWDIYTGNQIWQSPKADGYITDVSFSPDGKWFAVGGYDWNIAIYDIATGDTVKSIKVNPDKGLGYGIDLEFSPDGKWLAIGEDNRAAKLYNTTSWELMHTLKPAEGWCGGCGTMTAFSPDKQHITKLSNKAAIVAYSLETGQPTTTYLNTISDIAGVAYSSDGTKLMAANKDSVYVFAAESGQLLYAINPDVKAINHVVFHPDDEQLLVSGNDNRASLWSKEGKETMAFTGFLNLENNDGLDYDPNNYWQSHIARYIKYKNDLLLTGNAQYLLRGKVGTRARLWEVNSGNTVMEFIGHDKAVLCFDMTNDEKQLVTGGGDGKAILWDVHTGKIIRSFTGHRDPVFDIAISHDEQKIATCGWDGYVIVWDINTGEKLSKIYLGNVAAYNLAFTPNDVYLVLGKLDKTLELWEIDSQQKVKAFIGHTDIVTEIIWSANTNEFLTTGKDGHVTIWNMASGLVKDKYKHPKGAVNDAVFLATDRLITAGEDRIIRVWDLTTGKVVKELEGHQAEITSLNLDNDKSLLVSGDLDGVIKFWKLDTYEEFFEHIQIGESDWMVKTDAGYFYATDGAQANIHFVKGLKTYAADQFFETFFKPELLPELFQLKDKSRQKDIHGMLEQAPPPVLKFGKLPEKTDEEVTLQLKVVNMGGGINDLQLFHNGKRLDNKHIDLEVLEETKGYHIYKLRSPLVSGHNIFTAKAYSDLNIASLPAEIDITSTNTSPGSKCYILSVGINVYKNPKLTLNYAHADASSFVASIEKAGKNIFTEVEVISLFDAEATKENMLKKFDELAAKVHLNDVFIFYYAGHGSVVDEKFYFIPTEATRLYDGKTLDDEALEASVIQQKLEKIEALKQLIIMDACQSGKSVELLAQRGVLEEKAISQLSRSSGIHVMASAGSEQFAGEFVKLGHGLFTYLLLEALDGKADGAPKDGKITIYEIKSYLDDQVPEMSYKYKGKPQYPFTFSRGHDFPIGLLKN